MARYEARIVSGDGQPDIMVPLHCDDEAAAIRNARAMLDGHDIEVWRDNEKLGTLHHCSGQGKKSHLENLVSFRRP